MPLVFLKLGGSLITDKTRPYTPRADRLDDLAGQIASALRADPTLRLLLGHGSGSYGHTAASNFDTRNGVKGAEGWDGFAEVWYQASALNRLVVESLRHAGLPALTLSPAAAVTAAEGRICSWDLGPLHSALEAGVLPVIHGDVAFDKKRGGTILSTEDLFAHLARELRPGSILLAGLEEGVWADFPARTSLLRELTPGDLPRQAAGMEQRLGADVTGGMLSKVSEMLRLVEEIPTLEVRIFSGEETGAVLKALRGEASGTRLHG